MAITQTIATLPAVLNDSATFYEDIAERNNSLVTTILPSINAWATQANLTQTEINAKALQVAAQAVDGGYSQDYINSNFVGVSNAQTIAGIKTFSANPISSAVQSSSVNALTRRDFVTTLDAQNIKLSGNQTIAGVKTFTVSPIVPTPTATTQAVNKAYVDNKPSGFKNLIINGKKQVNQSGLTTTNNSYNYDNHYKVGNNWFMFIEGLDIESSSKYTLSWEGTATAGYYIGTSGSSTINIQSFTSIENGETIVPTITSSQFLWIKFASASTGGTYNKVQFEKGSVATPFENRLKGMEETLLQRYINVFSTSNISYGLLSSGAATAGATASIPFAFKSRMRTVPSFANLYPAVNYILTNGQGNITTAVAGFTLANASEGACALSITNSGGLTLGQGCNLLSNGSLSTSILFSARP